MKMQQLREKARSMEIVPGLMNKTALIRTIQEKEGNFPCFKTEVTDCDQVDCCWRSDCKPRNSPRLC